MQVRMKKKPHHKQWKRWIHQERNSHQFFNTQLKNLYTAVTKNGSTDNIEAAPPIPPHTVEELYTAVMKMPKENAEDGDKAPPIPPYTVEEISTWT